MAVNSTNRPVLTAEIGCGPATGDGDRAHDRMGSTILVDIDLDALQSRRRPASTAARAVCADGAHLPLAPASLSVVRLRAVLHHLVDTDRALDELARVLVDGGTMIIADGVALPSADARSLDAELRRNGHPTESIHGFEPQELAARAARAGFTIEDLSIDGVTTWATPPFVSTTWTSDRFVLVARRCPAGP